MASKSSEPRWSYNHRAGTTVCRADRPASTSARKAGSGLAAAFNSGLRVAQARFISVPKFRGSQPSEPAETPVEQGTDRAHDTQGCEITPAGARFGHVDEVHPVDARYRGGNAENARPCGELPGDGRLPLLLEQAAGFQRRADDIDEPCRHGLDAHEVVQNIPEIRPGRAGNTRYVERRQLVAYLHHPGDGMLEVDRLAPELEDARDLGTAERVAQEPLFDEQDFVGNHLHDREVVVHDEIEHLVHHELRPFHVAPRDPVDAFPQPMTERGFHPADRDDPPLGEENAHVGILDFAGPQLGRLRDDEDVIRIEVELGDLRVAHRILDGELMQAEHALERFDFLAARIDHVDPGKSAPWQTKRRAIPWNPGWRVLPAMNGRDDAHTRSSFRPMRFLRLRAPGKSRRARPSLPYGEAAPSPGARNGRCSRAGSARGSPDARAPLPRNRRRERLRSPPFRAKIGRAHV